MRRELRRKILVKRNSRVFICSLILLAGVLMMWVNGGESEAGSYLSEATEAGEEVCLTCHDSYAKPEFRGIHHITAKGTEEVSCEDCHGPGSLHSESGDASQILTGKADYEFMQLSCRKCHNKIHCGFKGHKVKNCRVFCTDCHKIHQSPMKGNLTSPELELCTSCHHDIKARSRLPSHHPMKEGRMLCSSCHDITGQERFEKERVNETCLECHAQYRGPFVFEHAPVAENCTICHEPHGTVANNLLKQNEPFICLSCHQIHFHTQLEGYRGEFSSPRFPERGGLSHRESIKQSILTKCTQCHSPIHGSDLPSQALSGMGKGLTR